ncbi:MAG: undecaprenyldiphospho-muramoylpentapeptide beta-N-acetylglucosaminyltransferase [Nitrospirota bacterium]|nr:undecaprenyldiphospho-muramoylpentapeptide beta-N-acetylglucosaminyltransferase [Nitrospirota bacterium]MDH5768099.1 undecaprenyldiphospho-muramoylpentapeptide beta-N-acetylglucosaminyltransferase [Nitrospirota bacterium]
MRVIIAGGGTGGHIFPGLAIAEEFKHRYDATEMIFVGTEYGIEARVIPREGYTIKFLRAEGIVGVSVLKKIRAVMKMFLSLIDSYRIIRAVKPDIVVGVGGYASGAIVFISALMSIPTMILEQNSIPGLTNRILGKFVKAICITYQESISFFPKSKTYLTGNPIRIHILKGDSDSGYKLFSLDRGLFTVFVFGGSSGAQSINMAVIDALHYLYDLKDKIQFLHQTGISDYERIRELYRKHGFKGTVTPFIYQMGEAYAVADLVISRAGATTLAELTALGKPALLVPYPYAAGHHQEMNARKLLEMGAARMILNNKLKGEFLARDIRELYLHETLRADMQRNSRALGRPDAGAKAVDIAMSLVKQSSVNSFQPKGER